MSDTLKAPATKWETLSPSEIKEKAREIARTTKSDDEFRQRVKDELEYPYSKEGIAVTSVRRGGSPMVMFMLHHVEGTING